MSRARLLEHEVNEAPVKIQSLEREGNKLRNLISLVELKVDEMLKGRVLDEMPQPRATNAPPESIALSGWATCLLTQRELKGGFPRAFNIGLAQNRLTFYLSDLSYNLSR